MEVFFGSCALRQNADQGGTENFVSLSRLFLNFEVNCAGRTSLDPQGAPM
jgi:hypothetical protein